MTDADAVAVARGYDLIAGAYAREFGDELAGKPATAPARLPRRARCRARAGRRPGLRPDHFTRPRGAGSRFRPRRRPRAWSAWALGGLYCTEADSQSWQWDNGTNTPGYFRSYARTRLRGWAPWGCVGPSQDLTAGIRGGPQWAWSAFRES